MNNLNPLEILKLGVIGLGFLLAFLSYNLLAREQKKVEPRSSVLNAINIYMAFSIVLCVIGLFGQFKTNNDSKLSNNSKIEIQLLEARPIKTNIGNTKASIKEIENILDNQVKESLEKKCFNEKLSNDLYGKMNFLIYHGSNGYANNLSIKETNIDSTYYSCIEDVFRGTQFPEPTEPKKIFENEYWVSVSLKIKK